MGWIHLFKPDKKRIIATLVLFFILSPFLSLMYIPMIPLKMEGFEVKSVPYDPPNESGIEQSESKDTNNFIEHFNFFILLFSFILRVLVTYTLACLTIAGYKRLKK